MGKHLENYRKFIKTERIRTFHNDIEIFYANDVEDMLEAMAEALATNPKEPETVHGNEAEKEVCKCSIPKRDTIYPDLCAYCGNDFIEP